MYILIHVHKTVNNRRGVGIDQLPLISDLATISKSY